MTKNEELKAWQDFAESLPIESYSKGAMQSLLIELENAMRSDYLPTLSLFEAGQRASDLIEGAKNTAEGILKQAQEKADRIVSRAIETDLMYRARIDAWKVKAVKEIDAL
jgi:cell division septum initiation protein DivIVA